jgi:hypothetical protein
MNRREAIVLSAACAGITFPRRVVASETPAGTAVAADAIFARAKAVWRSRTEAPYVTFNLRERYTWRSRVHDNWWQAAYRASDAALALRRTIVPDDETQRLRGAAIALDFHWHHGNARADSLETNADADAFPILDPLIEPNASFGLLHHEQRAALAGSVPLAQTVVASAVPTPTTTPPAGDPGTGSLRELVRVEAVAHDYAIANAGLERIRGIDAYHLTLTPLRAPRLNRLRDLWVDAATSQTLQLAVHGLFDGKPYDDARWLVTYVDFGSLGYVQQICTDDTLRFGVDRFVTGLQFDFVGYAFPAEMSPLTFERML